MLKISARAWLSVLMAEILLFNSATANDLFAISEDCSDTARDWFAIAAESWAAFEDASEALVALVCSMAL
jgi:hypothetical protein